MNKSTPDWRRIISILIMLGLFVLDETPILAADEFQALRHRMVRMQIAGGLFERTPVKDETILGAMRKVPRHRFVPK